MTDERQADPFAPPEISTEVGCLHCQETYDSWQIEWRTKIDADGVERGFWCCPIPGCDGKGFGFDILPTDPNYQDEHGGWVFSNDDDEDDDNEEEWSEDDEAAWDEAGTSASEIDLEGNIPWDDSDPGQPPKKPPESDSDFPFSVN